MRYVTAIDPGPTESAFVRLEFTDSRNIKVTQFEKRPNDAIMLLFEKYHNCDYLVIEKIASYGMPVGAEVFETVRWSGRFEQRALDRDINFVHRITRGEVKMQICRSMKANDSTIRQALIDRFGGPACIKRDGPLYQVSGDVWAALAVGITWIETGGAR